MSRNVEKSEELKREILELVGRFGWFRMKEISRFIWRDTPGELAITYAYKFIQKLEQDEYVHLHKLEKKLGTVVILKRKARDFLRKNKVYVKPVNWEDWKPDRDFAHDVMTQSLFVTLALDSQLTDESMFYLTDRECRGATLESTNEVREWNGEVKVPDLIIKTKNGVLAIEVERAEKRGVENKRALVETLMTTNLFKAPYTYNKIKVDVVAVAYNPEQILERQIKNKFKEVKFKTIKVDNAKNIFFTVKNVMSQHGIEEMRAVVFKMKIEYGAVTSYELIDEMIKKERIYSFFNDKYETKDIDFDENIDFEEIYDFITFER